MMPSLGMRVWASQCSGHAQNPARSNTPAGISAIFRKKPADSACNNQKGQHLGLENKLDAIRADNQPQKKNAQPIAAIRNNIAHTKQKQSDGNSPIRPPFFVPSEIFAKFWKMSQENVPIFISFTHIFVGMDTEQNIFLDQHSGISQRTNMCYVTVIYEWSQNIRIAKNDNKYD